MTGNYGFGEAPVSFRHHESATSKKTEKPVGHAASRMEMIVHKACDTDVAYSEETHGKGSLASVFGRLCPPRTEDPGAGYRDQMKGLAKSMEGGSPNPGAAEAGMTFLGQFIDHDLTLDVTTRLDTVFQGSASSIMNLRTPRLDLDCVYGDGPEGSPFLYDQPFGETGKLLFGRYAGEGTSTENGLDLPRNRQGRALIGDPRNDENLFVSQVHGRKFIAQHNKYVDQFGLADAEKGFDQAKEQLIHDYHDMIVEKFLPSIINNDVLKPFLDWLGGGAAPATGKVSWDKIPDMPVEFSAAAYRFGHSMVRQRYEIQPGRVEQIFNGALRGFSPVATADNIDMSLFFGPNAQKAEPIDTHIPHALLNLPPEVVGTSEKNLAFRNMDRGQMSLRLPSGEELAAFLDLEVLDSNDKVKDVGLEGNTPLWYYILWEAENTGGKLGPLGGAIVAGVLVNLLRKGKSHRAAGLTS